MPFMAWGTAISSCLLFLVHMLGFWSPKVLQPNLWFSVGFWFWSGGGAASERQSLCVAGSG